MGYRPTEILSALDVGFEAKVIYLGSSVSVCLGPLSTDYYYIILDKFWIVAVSPSSDLIS